MQTIHIDNPEIEQYIKSVYGTNQSNLVKDFFSFIKTEIVLSEVKKGFDEVKKYENGSITLNNAEDFLNELKNDH
jgi:hypothetical protein